ncbi:MAG: YwqG family protein [Coriobacteriia bacterium]|nr:YwqG family protein [Coriobacteriia bacterium]
MSRIAKRGLVIGAILVACVIGIYLLGEIELLLSWRGVSLLIAAFIAVVGPALFAQAQESQEGLIKEDYHAARQEAANAARGQRVIPELTAQERAALLEALEGTKLACLRLTTHKRPTTVFESKFGGAPYLPPGFEYPHNKNKMSERLPLKLLCQLNFEQLPPLPGFPHRGLLQFYLAFEECEDTYGADFDHPTKQQSWCVIYHPNIITDESQLQAPPKFEHADAFFPIEGEFALEADADFMSMTSIDYRWESFITNHLDSMPMGEAIKGKYEVDDLAVLKDEELDFIGHRIGGYPYFTQVDPRIDKRYREYSTLLLQIDSEDEIMWGDAGVATFFIKPEALAQGDFSDVLYSWDCW